MRRDPLIRLEAREGPRFLHLGASLAALALLFVLDRPESIPAPPPANDWVSQARLAIETSEYHASVTEQGLQAPNRAQNLRTYFKDSGIEVRPRTGNASAWRWEWKTVGWGRETIRPVPDVSPTASGTRVEFARDGFVEWYENRKEGLEQGFTVSARPDGIGPLRIEGQVSPELRAELHADGAGLDLLDAQGALVLRYAGLVVRDASQRTLEARLALAQSSLHIVVDDRGAAYPIVIDPLMTSPAWTADADQDSTNFAANVATAGDVNGDGYSDVIIGAGQYDNGQVDEGRVFVYLGSNTGLAATPAWTAESNQAGAGFGRVAPAGDVNADGYDDVLVGAVDYDSIATDEGRAFLYLGSPSGPAASPAWIAWGNMLGSGAHFGIVSTAGDVNGDGYSDVIVGAYQNSGGRAFVYLGSASGLATSAAWTGVGVSSGAEFGFSVGTAGDVNGDGFDDVIVGARRFHNGPPNNEGAAYVYLGSGSGPGTNPAWTVEGGQAQGLFGHSVSTAGDVNGDGYADVIVGAVFYTSGQANEGKAFAYYGSDSGLATSPAWTGEGNQGSVNFGVSVATAGDINGDGFADVIVGAERFDNPLADEGKAFLYLGSASGLSLTSAWTDEGNETNAFYGRCVSTAGDVNGDGYSDVIVGAHLFGATNKGRAFVYLGSAALPATVAAWSFDGDQAGAQIGWSTSSAGDVNGDGYSDVLVGSDFYDNGSGMHGRTWLFLGSADGLALTPAWTVGSSPTFDYQGFGYAVAGAGDVNGDGYDDLLIGTRGWNNATGNGGAFVYFGSASGVGLNAGWSVQGPFGSGFGVSVAGADVNGDGYSDVIVGAWSLDTGLDAGGEGGAFVYLSSASGPALSPSSTCLGDQTLSRMGDAVGAAGDVNGDGYGDVVIGAKEYDAAQIDEGRALLYLGSPSGLATSPAWTADGTLNTGLFGYSVSTAGDVNGDGYSDVIVGEVYFGPAQPTEGRGLVYAGSSMGLSASPTWELESNQTGAGAGEPVATAGDVNGDGYSDVVIGATGYDFGVSNAGAALVYLGSAAGLPDTVSVLLTGDQAGNSNFGHGSATAGDVNGDGFDDLIVGAYTYDNPENNEGKVFLYYGNEVDGLHRIPQARRADDAAPIALHGKSDSRTSFRLRALGRTPAGRGRVRLVSEVKPFGTAFSGSGTSTTSWSNTGTPTGSGSATTLNQLVSSLSMESKYHWRLRIESNSPFFPRSPWFTPTPKGAEEIALRTPGFTAQPLFGPRTDFATAGSPQAIATGDLDGDGNLDLALPTLASSKISVLLGNGDGTFGPKTDFAIGASTSDDPVALVIGDWNGDGRQDIAAAIANTNKVSVILGNGNGTFQPPSNYSTAGSQPVSIATSDLNEDGWLDLVTADFGGGVSLFTGNGTTFTLLGSVSVQSGPSSVAIGRVDADAHDDLVVANRSSNTVSILLGNGAGAFSSAGNPATAAAPIWVALADLNGNGTRDLAVADNGTDSVSVLLGNGNGTFGSRTNYRVGSAPSCVGIADFDGDGARDLVATNASSNTVSILPGTGSGTFSSKIDFATATDPHVVAIADLNRDGRRDLAVSAATASRASVLLNLGGAAVADVAPVVTCPVSVNAEEGGLVTFTVLASDLDGDGINTLTANLSGLPAGHGATFTTNGTHTSGTFTWHPTSAQAGTYNIPFSASNLLSGASTTRIEVAPAGSSVAGTLLWTPALADTGMYDITYFALDSSGLADTAVTHVTVTAPSPSPMPAIHPAPLAVQQPMKGPVIRALTSITIDAGSTLILSTSATGATTLTTSTEQLPPENNATYATDLQPTVSGVLTVSANPGEQVLIVLSITDPEGDPITSLTANLSALRPGNNAVFTPNPSNTAATFTWTPALADSGNYGITFLATNALVTVFPAVISVGNRLTGYWQLNGSGTDGAKGNTLVPTGGVTFAAGKLNLAADVNGGGAGKLTAPVTHIYDLASSGFSVESWVKPRSLSFGPDPTIARADSGTGAEAWELFACGSGCPTGKAGIRIVHSGSPTQLISRALINDGAFHHLAATYDGAALKLYVDGALDTTLAMTSLQAAVGGGTLTLGNNAAGTSQFDGWIDEFRVWSMARSAAQITAMMNTELGYVTGVEDRTAPVPFALFQNRPNPFNPYTRIRFSVPKAGPVRLYIYDVQGRLVRRLVDGALPPGLTQVEWPARDDRGHGVASGIYFYRLDAGGMSSTRRMVLLR